MSCCTTEVFFMSSTLFTLYLHSIQSFSFSLQAKWLHTLIIYIHLHKASQKQAKPFFYPQQTIFSLSFSVPLYQPFLCIISINICKPVHKVHQGLLSICITTTIVNTPFPYFPMVSRASDGTVKAKYRIERQNTT